MKRLLHFLAFLALPASFAHADTFQSGIEAYEAGDYTQALQHFKNSLDSGETAAHRHNLAIASFHLGEPAEAVWQIERAMALAPFNFEYRSKIDTLRSHLGLFKDRPAWYLVMARSLTFDQWFLLATAGFWTIVALLLLPFAGGIRLPLALKRIRLVAIGLFGLSLPALFLQARTSKDGIILAHEWTPLYMAPSTSAPEAGLARPGERARLLEQYQDLVKVRTEGYATGWIPKEAFRKLAIEPDQQ